MNGNQTEETNTKGPVPVLIDTDCGVDDAVALAMALCARDVCEVVAVTCVDGNAPLADVAVNVARVLRHCGRADVPYYCGCDRALLAPFAGPHHRFEGHGPTGLGDAPAEPATALPAPQGAHAALAIAQHARACAARGTPLHVVALGPLTNLAAAAVLDPALPALLAGVTVMGGTLAAQGNAGLASEFNFDSDPEAAQIVLARYGPALPAGVRLVPWEMFALTLPWATFDRVFPPDPARAPPLAAWFRPVLATLVRVLRCNPAHTGVYLPDAVAVLAAIRPCAVTRATSLYAVVETAGTHTRGAVAFDWARTTGKKPNCTLIQEIDYDAYVKHLESVFCSSS